MNKVFRFVARYSGQAIATGFIFVLVFETSLFFATYFQPSPRPELSQAARDSLGRTGALLMTLSTPGQVLEHHPNFVVAGWAVCFAGWLFLPLVVGAFVNACSRCSEMETMLRFKLEQWARDCGLNGENAQVFAERGLREVKAVLAEKGGFIR